MMLQNLSRAKYTVIHDLDLDILEFGPGALPDLAHINAVQIVQVVWSRTALFHEKVPTAAHGAWPWWPPFVFDPDNLGYSVAHIPTADMQNYERVPLYISPEGTAWCSSP
ncbi:hypothetical protein DL770_000056 [Monosporascus sp. CRB-9-2]|nr:hypothetical protein DL770_000056 [Monosporascus sp. CRB-9-2]